MMYKSRPRYRDIDDPMIQTPHWKTDYVFSFWRDVPGASEPVKTECPLQCQRCPFVRGKMACKNQVCFSLPFCWRHTRDTFKVRLGETTVPGNDQVQMEHGTRTGGRVRYRRQGQTIVKSDPATKFVPGLFASSPGHKREVDPAFTVFKKGDWICPLVGTPMPDAAGLPLGPYTFRNGGQRFEGGCSRYAGHWVQPATGPTRANAMIEFRQQYDTEIPTPNKVGSFVIPAGPWLMATACIHQGEEILSAMSDDYVRKPPDVIRFKVKRVKTKTERGRARTE